MITKFILIFIFACGQPDTIIIKPPNERAYYTREVTNPVVIKDVLQILESKPIVIKYIENRGQCA